MLASILLYASIASCRELSCVTSGSWMQIVDSSRYSSESPARRRASRDLRLSAAAGVRGGRGLQGRKRERGLRVGEEEDEWEREAGRGEGEGEEDKEEEEGKEEEEEEDDTHAGNTEDDPPRPFVFIFLAVSLRFNTLVPLPSLLPNTLCTDTGVSRCCWSRSVSCACVSACAHVLERRLMLTGGGGG